MVRLWALIAVFIALISIAAACTQSSSLVLRQSTPSSYWPRHRTGLSGRYHSPGGGWVYSSGRDTGSRFSGGGPGSGK